MAKKMKTREKQLELIFLLPSKKCGIINKATVENKILQVLNERVGCQKLHKHYQSRIKFLKNLYNSYVDLQRNSSGFGWDFGTKRFTASEEVWQGYLKAHPNHQYSAMTHMNR
ncbi:unnamed protein product, partial [Brassica rapa subsp. trilocularis]